MNMLAYTVHAQFLTYVDACKLSCKCLLWIRCQFAVQHISLKLPGDPCSIANRHHCRSYYGTISYLPAQFGLLAASTIVNDIIDGPNNNKHARKHKLYKQQRKQEKARDSARGTTSQRGLGHMQLKKWKARQLSQILREHEHEQQQQEQRLQIAPSDSSQQPSDHSHQQTRDKMAQGGSAQSLGGHGGL